MLSGITTLMRPLLKTAHSQPRLSSADVNVASAPIVSNSRNLRLARRSSTRLQMEAICPFRRISTSSQVSSTSRSRCEESSRQISLASRSEEHTSELQSQSNLVCRLLLEKKQQLYISTATIVLAATNAQAS